MRHQQGLHFSTASHLRVRWLKAFAQFSPQYQRTRHKEGVFQIIGPTERSIEKGVAEIGPFGFVLASERRVVSICRGDDKCFSIGETRYEDARIASRNDHDLVSHSRAAEHLRKIGWLESFDQPSCDDGKAIAGAVRRKDQKHNVALAIHPFCLRLQCCCKRLDSRAAARLGIVSYDHWVTPEPIGDDLRCTGGLTRKTPSSPNRPNDTTVILRRFSAACTVATCARVALPRPSVGVHLNAQVPGSSSQGLQQPSHADDRHRALYVVGEHIERHLSCHLRQPFREKVRCSHPALDGAERMFRCRTTHCHFLWMVIEARLHSLKHGLVFPSGDQSLLASGAAMLDSATLTGVGPVATQHHTLVRGRKEVGKLFVQQDKCTRLPPPRTGVLLA